MIFLTQIDIDRLALDYMIANTASYIFRKFKADPAIASLALKTVDDLIAGLEQIDSKSDKSIDDQIEGCALAVALLIGDGRSLILGRENKRSSINWLEKIVEFSRQNPRPTTSVSKLNANSYLVGQTPTIVVVSSVGGKNKFRRGNKENHVVQHVFGGVP